MCKQSPELGDILDLKKQSFNKILFPATFSSLKAAANVPSSLEGLNVSFGVIDELHRQKTPDLFQTLRYAGRAREQPLMVCITTAGTDRQSICWQQHEYSQSILDGKVIDTTYLPVMYAAHPGDDIEDPKTWHKANPSMGVTLNEKDFADELNQAKASPISLHSWLRYSLNIWTTSDFRFINANKWELCNKPVDPEQLRGQRCWAGCDLSSTKDTSSVVLLFEDGSILPFCFLPESEIDANPNYRHWRDSGYLILTPGSVIDYEYITGIINDAFDKYQFEAMFLDPYNAYQLTSKVEQLGINLQFHRQNMLNMNSPTKELERLVLSGHLKHGNHPVLSWQMENSVAKMDNIGNVMITKENREAKIDMAVALTMAVCARMHRDW